jgi:hypothetical protein
MNIHELLERQEEIMEFTKLEARKLCVLMEMSNTKTVEGRKALIAAASAICKNVGDVLAAEDWRATVE